MPLNITPSTLEQRKQLFAEILLNKTNKVSKVSSNSVLNGIAYGVAKVAGKAEKDIVLALSQLFPDLAFSSQLDTVANIYGIAPRFGASQSSTYVRVVGDLNTTYSPGVHTFSSVDGIEFDIEDEVVIGEFGYSYAKVRSVDSGSNTNVNPATITRVTPTPTGHRYCINEYQALGGRDIEDDTLFRKRIKDGANILAKDTLSELEQVFMLINNNVLRVIYQGINNYGQLKLAIVTQNGIDLNASELNELLVKGEKYFSFTELKPFGRQSYGIELVNIDWQPIDISFRLDTFASYSIDDIRINIQTQIAKYLDFRYWRSGIDKVEWDNLLQIVKNTRGVKYVADEYFYPRVDIATDKNKLPRIRSFIMLDLQGNVLQSLSGTLLPSFYPNKADLSFQSTALRSI